jgi:hypothetical protein
MFNMFPEDVTAEPGFAGTIFDPTCDEKKTWTNPNNPVLKYSLPDQVESITAVTNGTLSHKAVVTNIYQETIAGDRILLRVTGHVSAYQMELKPYSLEKMGASMKSFFDTQLPNNYAENPAKFQEFVGLFGTHYFTRADFGGVMILEVETSKDYSEKLTEKDLQLKASIAYDEIFTANGTHHTANNLTDKAFAQASNIKSYYYGGNAHLINTGSDGFKKWLDSALAQPWLFGGKLEQITSFLPAGLKKNAVQTAVNIKLDWAALDEMTTGLGYLKQNPHIDMAKANSFITHK